MTILPKKKSGQPKEPRSAQQGPSSVGGAVSVSSAVDHLMVGNPDDLGGLVVANNNAALVVSAPPHRKRTNPSGSASGSRTKSRTGAGVLGGKVVAAQNVDKVPMNYSIFVSTYLHLYYWLCWNSNPIYNLICHYEPPAL